jgi:hypothetical protein
VNELSFFAFFLTVALVFLFSLHRFLGYDTSYVMKHQYITFTLDFLLLLVLLVIVKPLVLILIYLELLVRLLLLSCFTFISSAWELSPRSMVRKHIFQPFFSFVFYFTGGFILSPDYSLSTYATHVGKRNAKRKRDLWECIMCVASLSLLMRFFTGPPSSTELKQHKKLAKMSFLYRFFHHII